MPTKRELLVQGYRGKRENEKLRRTKGCDSHCYFFYSRHQTSERPSIINLLMENSGIFQHCNKAPWPHTSKENFIIST